MEVISLREVLQEINKKDKDGNPFPFSVSVWSLNRQSKKGGSLKHYDKARLLVGKKVKNLSAASLLIAAQSAARLSKQPNHFKNRTRNIELENGDIKKIHIRLIDTFNGKKMQY
ncbi:hypothetical protein CXF68_09255 [Tenacibaculum sp. Bg11-29]|uniref:hypothetical protein n=1 Tax=Tenacibaculum sp. Bg11-29 TaxID=2058306 RepID=UPI000C3440B0|nr:hypothetical protein [Tenacibaculum sp. Bg11-29]PKH50861.1 hypothetical protein CXF68_09255 [Tenacibaculum sp. Bg11-29]